MADARGCGDSMFYVDSNLNAGDVVITESAEVCCYTKLKVVNIPYKWTIDNFSLRTEENGQFLETPPFSAAEMERVKWRWRLYPKGEYKKYKGYLSMFMKLVSSEKPKVSANIRMSILDTNGKEVNVVEFQKCFETGERCGPSKFISLKNLLDIGNGLLPDDKLTLSCKISIIVDSSVVSGSSICEYNKRKLPGLVEQVGKLYTSKLLCDVVFSVSGREFDCHKAVLAARSPVFAAMFERILKEETQNRVKITDIAPEVFQELLEFVYTERSPKMNELASDLLAAADEYGMEDLKVLCEEFLASELTIQNAAELLILADRHSASYLKSVTLNFIENLSSEEEIMKTSGWKALVRSHPKLVENVKMVASGLLRTVPVLVEIGLEALQGS